MKLFLFIAIITLNGSTSFSNYQAIPNVYTDIQDTQHAEAEAILKKLDCATCHKIEKKVAGPSYLDIAKKYPHNEKNINYLSDKIIKGGSGVWGAVPMLPHAALKKDDAKKIAKYILSLNK
ncbi:cytochrome c551/c552 [Flavobacterium cutihirudinis]|uniref:Cytochrome c551/c552 n=1 Tax=Flavobacterium cutihirudinis TaxID=1265740 RepID=A0A3D9FSF6_9FLAO|nr:c-type cytochrome [Flavobacterium cutihirudinis]RED22715.1 cytochrome c551/c552 [Flavobacterium cutihirudinis]